MREATDRRKEIEKEHGETLALLKEKQSDIQRKVTSTSEKSKAYESIETLQSKIRELEKKAELQNVLHEELVLEMAAIKRSAKAGNTPSWNKHSHEAHISPETSICSSDISCIEQPIVTGTCNSIDNHIEHRPILKSRSQFTVAPSATVLHSAPLTDAMHVHTQSNIGSEIDSIMEKIDQDNKVLAELDKTRFTIGRTPIGGRQLPLQPKISTGSLGTHLSASTGTVPSTNLPLTGIPNMQEALNRHNLSGNLTTDSAGNFVVTNTGVSILPQSAQATLPLNLAQNSICNPIGAQYQPFILSSGPNTTTHIRNQPPMILQQTHPQPRLMPQLPNIVPTQFDLDRIYGTFPDQHITVSQDPKVVDMLDIPGKGRCYVYIARYSYDPFQQSPNECPEAELAVNAGDYILVWGNMDEDGFYDAELLDGRRGLVPSNFVQKLIGDDLLDFHQSVIQGLRDCDDSASTNIPQDFDYHLNSGEFLSKKIADFDLSDILEEDDEEEEAEHSSEGPDVFFSVLVAAPKQLTLERQLNKSILIGWNPSDSPSSPPIDCYHVYVDRVLKVTVKATERTRALVEGVDSNRPHRISVRSVTANRRTSRDAACTMVIGKDVPLGPTNVKASRVTATSAVISWLPSNSNYQHVVCVNNVELRTVKPGVYRHTITGLAPNTVYRVTVRAKNIRAPHFDEKSNIAMERYSCHIDFRTLPKGCKDREPEMPVYNSLPEPPVDIQVEPGPQDGTLLVTWQPPNASSSVGGSIITGYAVYADGKKVTDVDSPSGDHALIDINKLLGLNPKQVTVRTKSRDSQSSDSIPTQIPIHILKDKHQNEKQEEERRLRYGSSIPAHMRHQHRPGQVIETEENLSDKEIYPNNNISIPAIEITKDTGSEGNYSEDDYLDRRSMGRGHYDSRGSGMRARSHHVQHHSRHHRRDDRDQFYSERGDGRAARERERPAYRGSRVPHPGPHQQGSREKRPRWFVALFDYDPTTMSPNPDACDEELPFTEGDTIKVFGDKDADGFYWGECRNRRGFVPHNMVIEVQGMDGGVQNVNKDRSRDRDRWGDIYANMPVKKMIAMYDYDPQELSPNVDAEQVELSFQTGNVIYVYGEMDDDGFYMGELDGVRGLVPSNFLTEAEPGKRSTRQGDRGHGPGARGPPPPPRPEPRSDRRKDACPVTSQVDHRQDGRVEKEPVHTPSHLSTARKYQAPPNPVVQLPPSIETKQQPNAAPATESLAPNLMQKLSEMTAGDNSVDHILSKGKELIFMKFGLGK
ncbi:RIMS-binding protein 2 [Halyomorpha halys]|uniref:RIMS-binding protein 2 n=1 Tax=Halyomorpha halys TaxID=286706 RepID=UPI0006D50E45|nr:RIMS-binding protein 2 isoform X2 [Halyomorpha halys]XP_014285830.1 RIMS-binding protein 2 isoform X2 [Halyomorpha halys]